MLKLKTEIPVKSVRQHPITIYFPSTSVQKLSFKLHAMLRRDIINNVLSIIFTLQQLSSSDLVGIVLGGAAVIFVVAVIFADLLQYSVTRF